MKPEILQAINQNIKCEHYDEEMNLILNDILNLKVDGCIVECGAFQGGSTAKLSYAVHEAGRQMYIFDSFKGLPATESFKHLFTGNALLFRKGDYFAELDGVKAAVTKWGKIEVCNFVKGWFRDTLPEFHEPIALIFLDIDLVSSTRTCLTYLLPLLVPGGILYSHDGHIPSVVDVYREFLGNFNNLGKEKLLRYKK